MGLHCVKHLDRHQRRASVVEMHAVLDARRICASLVDIETHEFGSSGRPCGCGHGTPPLGVIVAAIMIAINMS
jgi:hypothetical protein